MRKRPNKFYKRPKHKHPLEVLRESKGLSITDVEEASFIIAKRTGNPAYQLWRSRIKQIEYGSRPGPEKLATLAEIYGSTTEKLIELISHAAHPPIQEKKP